MPIEYSIYILTSTFQQLIEKSMGSTVTTPKPPPPVTENPMDTKDSAVYTDTEEWHILEFHLPTILTGGAGIIGLGIAACAANYAYKRWLDRTNKDRDRRQARLARMMAINRPALNHPEPNAPPAEDDVEAGDYAYRFRP